MLADVVFLHTCRLLIFSALSTTYTVHIYVDKGDDLGPEATEELIRKRRGKLARRQVGSLLVLAGDPLDNRVEMKVTFPSSQLLLTLSCLNRDVRLALSSSSWSPLDFMRPRGWCGCAVHRDSWRSSGATFHYDVPAHPRFFDTWFYSTAWKHFVPEEEKNCWPPPSEFFEQKKTFSLHEMD